MHCVPETIQCIVFINVDNYELFVNYYSEIVYFRLSGSRPTSPGGSETGRQPSSHPPMSRKRCKYYLFVVLIN